MEQLAIKKARLDQTDEINEVVSETIKEIYSKYYSDEVVDFFLELHNHDNIHKDIFTQDYETRQILKDTGRADRYDAVTRLTLILFAAGAVLALLIGNTYLVPVLGLGFSLIPVWYLRSTSASYKKHLNEELETAISIITTSYLRTEDLIRSVKENLAYINEPVKATFEAFVYESELINANTTSAINSLKMKIPNRVFHEWANILIQCQSDRSMKNTLPTIVQKFSDVRVVQSELEAMLQEPRREAITMMFLVIANVPLLYFLNQEIGRAHV